MDKATVTLDEGYCTTITARHHTWFADVPETSGGEDSAPNPEEMLLGAVGACIAMTAKMYANRKGWPLERIEINLELERFSGINYPGYQGDAQFIHEIREAITFHGALDHDQRARLLEIATKCPVRRVLTSPTFFIESLVEAETSL